VAKSCRVFFAWLVFLAVDRKNLRRRETQGPQNQELAGDRVQSVRLVTKQDFAAADQLVVNPQAVFKGAGLGAGARRSGLQTHASGRLKNIGGERTAVDVKFHAQIAGVTDPGDLIAGLEHHDFGENTNENWAFGHAKSLPSMAESAKFLAAKAG
jgi:hypothetical protein